MVFPFASSYFTLLNKLTGPRNPFQMLSMLSLKCRGEGQAGTWRGESKKGEQVGKKMKAKDTLEYDIHGNRICPSLSGLKQVWKQVLWLTLFFGS